MAGKPHTILGGKVHLYRRDDGGDHWFCTTFLKSKKHRKSTKEDDLSLAKEFAESWYFRLRGLAHAGLLKTERTFKQAAEQFLKEYGIITEGQRSPKWVEGHQIRLRLHLLPFFGELGLSEVTAGKVQEYRVHRATTPPAGSRRIEPKGDDGKPLPYKAPARSTLHDEIVTLRQVLKTAIRHGWLDHLPDLSPPYRTQGKIVHRPWFSPEEYKQLYQATRDYAKSPFHEHFQCNAEQVHDYVLFMANTGLRPDEAKNLQHRDVKIVVDGATRQKILEIEVRGKRGIGYCESTPSAVRPYERLLARAKPGLPQGKRARRRRGENPDEPLKQAIEHPLPTDPVFPATVSSCSTACSNAPTSSSTATAIVVPRIACDTPISACA